VKYRSNRHKIYPEPFYISHIAYQARIKFSLSKSGSEIDRLPVKNFLCLEILKTNQYQPQGLYTGCVFGIF